MKNYNGELATRLNEFTTLGQKEASKHRPPPDADSPDLHETGLRVAGNGWLSAEQHNFDHVLTEASRCIVGARQKVIELRANAEQIMSDDSAASAVEAEIAGIRSALLRATEDRLGAEVDLNYFRAVNGINEEARYPESLPWHFGVLAILVVVETAVNAFFFENSQGLLGGVMVALGIAALNMVTALFCGAAFRYKNLSALDRKAIGWSAFVIFIGLALFCNALFSSFRSEYQAVADPSEFAQVSEAFKNAWPKAILFFRGDIEFTDHWSFLLFGIGLMLSIWAFYKGYTLDDKFPGHGPKAREYKKAELEERNTQDLVRGKVKELFHHRRAAVQAALHEPTTQVGILSRRIADLTHSRQLLGQRASAVRRDYALVIGSYRQANMAVRALPPPNYFRQTADLDAMVDDSGADGVISELSEVQNELKNLADVQRDGLNARLNALQNNSAVLLNQTLASFLSAVQQEAETNIARRTPTIHRIQSNASP